MNSIRKNRKVVRVVTKELSAPKNLRVTDRKSAALDRTCFWFLLATFSLCSSSAALYVAVGIASRTPDANPESLLVIYSLASLLFGILFAKRTLSAWSDVSFCEEKLRRRDQLHASVLRTLDPPPALRGPEWRH